MNFISTTELYKEGYGIIAKKAMRDKNLSVEAKAIYSYICSFAGAGATSFPGVSLMLNELGISEKRFYTHRKQLIENGYISIIKQRKNNRADRNLYTIEPNPKKIEVDSEEKEVIEKLPEKESEKVVTESNIDVIEKLCEVTNFKLKNKKNIKLLIDTYSLDKVYKAIATASSTQMFLEGKIKNCYGYLMKILNESEKVKVTNINITKEEKKSSFNNYTQREYDYEELGEELMGFD